MRKIRTAVLISGRGSNMVALAESAQHPDFPAEIVLVISNNPDAAGLEKAKSMGIDTAAIDHRDYKGRKSFERKLHQSLKASDVELICCAGFMRILSPWLVSKWQNRILNIHPSLLPKYKGLHTHQRALDAGDTHHGCSVHWVNEELDGGAIVAQEAIEIRSGDTAHRLATRLIPIEHQLYVRALQTVATELRTS